MRRYFWDTIGAIVILGVIVWGLMWLGARGLLCNDGSLDSETPITIHVGPE